jgi:hypothetical protein
MTAVVRGGSNKRGTIFLSLFAVFSVAMMLAAALMARLRAMLQPEPTVSSGFGLR